MNLPPDIAERIREAITNLTPHDGFHIEDEGIRADALPLMGTIGSVWLLRADGTFWEVDSDFGRPLTPLAPHLENQALAYGTERYPWLEVLLPKRPRHLPPCGKCAGRRLVVPVNAITSFACPECNGVGWKEPKT